MLSQRETHKIGELRVECDAANYWWVCRWNGEEWVAYRFRFCDRGSAQQFLDMRLGVQ